MLRPLLDEYDPLTIRRRGDKVLGFPPDVFGVTGQEYRTLFDALRATTGKER
jgi:hypothetical protein